MVQHPLYTFSDELCLSYRCQVLVHCLLDYNALKLQVREGTFIEGSLESKMPKETKFPKDSTLRARTTLGSTQIKEDTTPSVYYQVMGNLEIGDGFGGGLQFLKDDTITGLGVLAKTELKLYSVPVLTITKLMDADSAFQQMKDEVSLSCHFVSVMKDLHL